MKHYLENWRANHYIQPYTTYIQLDPFGMVQHILSHVTKAQKGRNIIMEVACQETKDGNVVLKAPIRHIGNAFFSDIEVSEEEAACLTLQLPVMRMSRQALILNIAHPDIGLS